MAVSSCGRTTLGVLVEGLLVIGVDAIAAKKSRVNRKYWWSRIARCSWLRAEIE